MLTCFGDVIEPSGKPPDDENERKLWLAVIILLALLVIMLCLTANEVPHERI